MTDDRGAADGSSSVVRLGHSHAQFFVEVGVVRHSNGWHLRLARTERSIEVGDRRVQEAVRRFVNLDVATEYALRRDRHIDVHVPLQPRVRNEAYSPAELVAPLLRDRRVNDSLYGFQRNGVAWLLRHPRALLGDDMGLGKTAQALGAARRLVRWGSIEWCLVVSPRTLLPNWQAEAARWAPELTCAIARPSGSHRQSEWSRIAGRSHIVVTNYEQLRDPPAVLLERSPPLVIADEAHRLRKAASQTTQGLRQVAKQRFWALTGTPVERDAEDLAVLMSLLDPLRFSPDDSKLHPSALRARVRPYLLRRRKEDVLDELPPTIESHELVELSEAQLLAYRAAVVEHAKARDPSILPLFNRLRSICDLDPTSGSSSKLDRIEELLDDVKTASEKGVVFSYQLAPIRELSRRLAARDVGHEVLIGNMSLDQRQVAIERFLKDPDCTALVASTRVASEGLTLTAANHVFFVNRWWNPSANDQATDRVRRIGQHRTVHVRSFTCRGTVEERVGLLLAEKRLTFNELIEALTTDPLALASELLEVD